MFRFWSTFIFLLFTTQGALAWQSDGYQTRETPDYIRVVLPDDLSTTDPATWQGIDPATTPYKEARTIIANLPNSEPQMETDTWQFSPDENHWHVVQLDAKTGTIVIMPDDVRLGEVLLGMGEPDYQTIRFEVIAQKFTNTRIVSLYYAAQQVIVALRVSKDVERLSPHLMVSSITYSDKAPTRPRDALDWQGFWFIPDTPTFSR